MVGICGNILMTFIDRIFFVSKSNSFTSEHSSHDTDDDLAAAASVAIVLARVASADVFTQLSLLSSVWLMIMQVHCCDHTICCHYYFLIVDDNIQQ